MFVDIANAYSKGLITILAGKMSDANLTLATVGLGIILSALIGYLLGSLNFGIILSGKMYKDDIRNYGSKNAGTTNMMRTYGTKAAVFTIIGDALKAVVAVIIGAFISGLVYGGYAAALGCMLGHVFPLYYKFKGGKGVATAAAAILVLNPTAFVCVIAVFVLCVAISKYISLGSVLAAMLFPLVTFYTYFGGSRAYVGSGFAFICAFLMAILVIAKHYQNIIRLSQGKESKFKFKKSK